MKYSAVKKLLTEKIGLDIDSVGENHFIRQVESHMKRVGLSTVGKYLSLIKSSEEELAYLIDNTVVHETWFFRDTGSFDYLKKYVETVWIPSQSSERLTVLSVPCSSGEEPYSIAMTLIDAGLSPDRFHIDAVDISEKDIEKSLRAVYGKASFRCKKIDDYRKHFSQTEDGFILKDRITELVSFRQGNCLNPDFLRHHDPYCIIFCRNLLIYLSSEARTRLLLNLDSILRHGFLLFTGHSETSLFTQFGYVPINFPRSFAFTKSDRKKQPVRDIEKNNAIVPIINIKRNNDLRPSINTSKIRHVRSSGKHSLKTVKRASILQKIRILANKGDLDEAFALCELYLEHNEPSAEAYYLMGLINHAFNRLSMAEDFLLKSVYLDPCHYEALLHLSLLYEHRGDIHKKILYHKRAESCHERSKKQSIVEK